MNCNPQPYQITTFSYKPVKKGMTIEEQQKFFVKLVQQWVNKNPNKHPSWFLNEFVSKRPENGGYWNCVPDNKDKTYYFLLPKKQREKWSTGGRLNTQKGFKAKDPRWKASKMKPKEIDYVPPRLANMDEYSPINYDAYKERISKEERSGEPVRLGERLKQNFGR